MATGAMNGESIPHSQNGSNPKNRRRALGAQLLNIEQLADWLGVEQGFIRRLVAERRIPFVKIGKFVRFDPDEITVWVDSRRVATEPSAGFRRAFRNRP